MIKAIFLSLIILSLLVSPAFGQVDIEIDIEKKDNRIKDQWIAVLNDECGLGAKNNMPKTYGLIKLKDYSNIYNGFSFTATEAKVAKLLENDCIKSVTQDIEVEIIVETVPIGITRIESPHPGTDYKSTALVVIMDTGLIEHEDLNVIGGKNFVTSEGDIDQWQDEHGHGTHTGGTACGIGGNDIGVIGVAPGCELFAYRVLGATGSGSFSGINAALDDIAGLPEDELPDAVNMSFGGSLSTPVTGTCETTIDANYLALCAVAKRGVLLIAAAGNSNRDSATFVPAAYNDAVITVSAIDPITDRMASFSNFGAIVDIGSPGVNTLSTVPKEGASCCSDPSGYKSLSGTSMAAPHVSGWAAEYKQVNDVVDLEGVHEFRNALRQLGFVQSSDKGFTGDKDIFPEPMLNAGSGFIREDIIDVELSNLLIPKQIILIGETVDIFVQVQNVGTSEPEILTLTVKHGDIVIYQEDITLNRNESKDLQIPWDTTGATSGKTTLTATVTSTNDQNLVNNEGSVDITLIAEGDYDIAITKLEFPDTAARNQMIKLNVTVANEGIVVTSGTLRISDLTQPSGGVSLLIGFNLNPDTERSWSINYLIRESLTIGLHNLEAVIAPYPGETDLGDNKRQATITITEFATEPVPPVTFQDFFIVNGTSTTDLDVLANDKDANGNDTIDKTSVKLINTGWPRYGEATVLPNGEIRYKNTDQTTSTQDLVRYTVDDDTGLTSNQSWLVLRINPVDEPDDPLPDPEPEPTPPDETIKLIKEKLDQILALEAEIRSLLDSIIIDDGSKLILDAIREILKT